MAFQALTKLGSDVQVAPLEYLLQKLKYVRTSFSKKALFNWISRNCL